MAKSMYIPASIFRPGGGGGAGGGGPVRVCAKPTKLTNKNKIEASIFLLYFIMRV